MVTRANHAEIVRCQVISPGAIFSLALGNMVVMEQGGLIIDRRFAVVADADALGRHDMAYRILDLLRIADGAGCGDLGFDRIARRQAKKLRDCIERCPGIERKLGIALNLCFGEISKALMQSDGRIDSLPDLWARQPNFRLAEAATSRRSRWLKKKRMDVRA